MMLVMRMMMKMQHKVRKRSQSAGPGKFDKKMGKEDSFDQVSREFCQIVLSKELEKMLKIWKQNSFAQGGEGEVAKTTRGRGEWGGRGGDQLEETDARYFNNSNPGIAKTLIQLR